MNNCLVPDATLAAANISCHIISATFSGTIESYRIRYPHRAKDLHLAHIILSYHMSSIYYVCIHISYNSFPLYPLDICKFCQNVRVWDPQTPLPLFLYLLIFTRSISQDDTFASVYFFPVHSFVHNLISWLKLFMHIFGVYVFMLCLNESFINAFL